MSSFARLAVFSAIVLGVVANEASAAMGILGVMGADQVAKPTDLSLSESSRPIIFQEAAGVPLSSTLDVDHDGSGVIAVPAVSGNTIAPGLSPGTVSNGLALAAGTPVDSYLFHFDPVGTPLLRTYVTAITFASPVIGVQLFSNQLSLLDDGQAYQGTLEAGDALFGDTSYPTQANRGVEEDAFLLAVSGNTVVVAGSVSGAGIDQIRFLTLGAGITPDGVIPEPLSLGVWVGIACVASASRRR